MITVDLTIVCDWEGYTVCNNRQLNQIQISEDNQLVILINERHKIWKWTKPLSKSQSDTMIIMYLFYFCTIQHTYIK